MNKYENKYDILVAKARQAYKNQDLENAAQLYEEAFTEEVHLDDLLHLGAIYIDLKKYNKAIQIFKDIIEIQKNNFLAYYGLASCYSDLGMIEDAINSFKLAISAKPDYADAFFGIALLYDYQEQDECEKYYLETIKYDSSHYWANTNLSSYYDKKDDLDLALRYALKAYEVDSNGKLISFNLGVIYSKLKDYEKAIFHYKEEINKNNPYIDAYLNLGLIYKDIYKDYNNALICYTEGISIDKDYSDLWYNLGCLYAIMDDQENAYNCLLYANLKNLKLRDYMYEDLELLEFKKSSTYEKLLKTING